MAAPASTRADARQRRLTDARAALQSEEVPPTVVDLAQRAAQLQRPREALTALAELRTTLDALESALVENALRAGWSWREIADVLGVSKQAVHKKHARTLVGGDPAGEKKKLTVTGHARQSVHFARQEARRLGHDSVGTEHLLLGLLRDERGPVGLVLGTIGVTLEAARREVERLHARRRRRNARETAAAGTVAIQARAREAFEQSLREAVRLRDDHLGVEHILLALLREEGGAAVKVLEALGVRAAVVEQRLDDFLQRSESSVRPPAGAPA